MPSLPRDLQGHRPKSFQQKFCQRSCAQRKWPPRLKASSMLGGQRFIMQLEEVEGYALSLAGLQQKQTIFLAKRFEWNSAPKKMHSTQKPFLPNKLFTGRLLSHPPCPLLGFLHYFWCEGDFWIFLYSSIFSCFCPCVLFRLSLRPYLLNLILSFTVH